MKVSVAGHRKPNSQAGAKPEPARASNMCRCRSRMDGNAPFLTVYLRGISARSCNARLPTYVPMPCVGLRGKIHVSLDELRKRGHIPPSRKGSFGRVLNIRTVPANTSRCGLDSLINTLPSNDKGWSSGSLRPLTLEQTGFLACSCCVCSISATPHPPERLSTLLTDQ